MEEEGTGAILQEILRKLESLDSRVSVMETKPQEGYRKDSVMPEEEGGVVGMLIRGADYHTDRVTRQTKVEFSLYDGSRVQDWIFKSERVF